MMLRSIKQLFGAKLKAAGDEIGRVKDFYFDDRAWAIRYLIADTGSWLPERQVLISPHALGDLEKAGRLIITNLSREKIEGSPVIETGRRLSRQDEEDCHRYYGWPDYWQGGRLWGWSGLPNESRPSGPDASEPAAAAEQSPPPAHDHLRSTRTVKEYGIQMSDTTTGHLCDFLIDPKSWAIVQLAVKTGRRFSGQEVRIATSSVERISDEESTVFVGLTKEGLEHSPAHLSTPLCPR